MHPRTLSRLLTQELSILPYEEGDRDELNDPSQGFGDAISVRGYVEPIHRLGVEDTRDRETTVSSWRAILPPDTVVSHRDRVIADGKTFEVEMVAPFHNPLRRRRNHIEATLRLLEG